MAENENNLLDYVTGIVTVTMGVLIVMFIVYGPRVIQAQANGIAFSFALYLVVVGGARFASRGTARVLSALGTFGMILFYFLSLLLTSRVVG